MRPESCSAYRPGKLCANGFPLTYPPSSACTGYVCRVCKEPNKIVPACQEEEIHLRWLSLDGSPKFAENKNGGNK